MSAPTELHERRRRALGDLATLAGYTGLSALGDGLVPDVCRRDGEGRLLCADAKATEGPTCEHTLRRLVHYARRCGREPAPAVLMVAHDPAQSWDATLRRAARRAGLRVLAQDRFDLETMAVSHVVVHN